MKPRHDEWYAAAPAARGLIILDTPINLARTGQRRRRAAAKAQEF